MRSAAIDSLFTLKAVHNGGVHHAIHTRGLNLSRFTMNVAPTQLQSPWRLRIERVAEIIDRLPAAVFAVIPFIFFVVMAVGLVRWYTPVPFWDMWDAYLAAYIDYLDGNWRALFVQTNEHRIWFSDVLFYLDLTFFGGRSLLLVPFNGLLAVLTWAALAAIARHLLKDRPGLWPVTALALGPLCFSWLQEQNLSWGFQSQFFVAYLFPLVAFACLAMSFRPRGRGWFGAALLFGLASLGTMANGLLVLPLLCVMLVAMPHPSWRRAGVAAVITLAAIFAWFQGYFLVERDHANFSQVVTFILTFFGLPFESMFRYAAANYVAGAFFIAASAVFGVRWLRARADLDPMILALVIFLIYVGLSCAVIALGRAAIQPNAALVSRYSTPSLVAWGALALLFAHAFRTARFARASVIVIGAVVALGLWDAQAVAFSDAGPDSVHSKMSGALALKMRVRDLQAIGNLYPTSTPDAVGQVLRVAQRAEEERLSIMNAGELIAAVGAIGKSAEQGFHPCRGVVHEPEAIDGEAAYLRVTGWVFDADGDMPDFVYIDHDGVIEGVAVTGHKRADVAQQVDPRALWGGFTGYIRSGAAAGALRTACPDRPTNAN
ncbi:MAG: hypothetical protein AB7I36_03085 [Rhodospirillaceae bacterium]